MNRPTVLVLGANGRFGRAAVDAFAAAGWRVLAQMRRAGAGLPSGTRALDIPLADTTALAAQAAGASVVVHAINPIYTEWEAHVLPLGRLGMDIAERLGALFMLPGNVYNFGEAMPALLDEAVPERPTTSKGRLRAVLEAEMAARASTSGLSSVVIRAGDFFGGGTGSWLDQVIVKSLRQGKLTYPGRTDIAHAWAYLPDLARAFVAVASRPLPGRATARRFHFEGHTLTGAQCLDAVEAAAAELGLAPARGFARTKLPWGLIRAGGLVWPMWRELARMSYLWRVPHALDGHALQREVGSLPVTPIGAAMRESLLALGFSNAGRAVGAAAA